MNNVTMLGTKLLTQVAEDIRNDPNYSGEGWYSNGGCAMTRMVRALGYSTRTSIYGIGESPINFKHILANHTGVPTDFWHLQFQAWSTEATNSETADVLVRLAAGEEFILPQPVRDHSINIDFARMTEFSLGRQVGLSTLENTFVGVGTSIGRMNSGNARYCEFDASMCSLWSDAIGYTVERCITAPVIEAPTADMSWLADLCNSNAISDEHRQLVMAGIYETASAIEPHYAVSESGKVALLATAQQIINDPAYSGESWYKNDCGCAMVRTLQNLGYTHSTPYASYVDLKNDDGETVSMPCYSTIISRHTGIPESFWDDEFQDWSVRATAADTADVLTLLANGQDINFDKYTPLPDPDDDDDDAIFDDGMPDPDILGEEDDTPVHEDSYANEDTENDL